uniref:Large ribosomal subunit protein bL12 n=1 Tax=candidate division WOR-3 bacterium TaxID=2052148 RepID=A0A7V3ZUR3_UNCW3
MSSKIDELINIIENLTVMELAELVQRLKDKFGITHTAFVTPAVSSAQSTTASEVKEEKTEFTVTLIAVGDKKIQVLKELRALTNLGLKEAKDLIDNVPSIIKEKATKEEAEKIKAKLEEVGAKVEIK